jgi:NAD(P)-dependent dehydrogenase (short-subunit alcohol dehydrogenase family)
MSNNKLTNHYFANKVVIITGGAGGLAAALIEQLLSSGAKVAALDINVSTLTETEQLLPITTDITSKDAINNAIRQVINKFNKVDILVNNAGITHMSRFKELSATLFETIMAVNFTGSVEITRQCLPYLSDSKGQIVAISSVAGFAPLYGRSAYSASKHAMEGFFRSLASEVEEEGISVLVVCPSFVKSRPELTAQVNKGISSPGAMKKSTNGEQLSPEYAAKKILLATAKRKQNLYLGKVANIAYWLFSLLPKTYMKIMTKQAKAEFE